MLHKISVTKRFPTLHQDLCTVLFTFLNCKTMTCLCSSFFFQNTASGLLYRHAILSTPVILRDELTQSFHPIWEYARQVHYMGNTSPAGLCQLKPWPHQDAWCDAVLKKPENGGRNTLDRCTIWNRWPQIFFRWFVLSKTKQEVKKPKHTPYA